MLQYVVMFFKIISYYNDMNLINFHDIRYTLMFFLTKYQSYVILEKLTNYKNISVVDDYHVHNVVLQERKNGIWLNYMNIIC